MRDYWFKPKSHGYGAAPANWKGWVATAAFVAAVYAILWPWVLAPTFSDELPTTGGIVGSIALVVIATAGFIWLTKIKTDGEWKWRWGEKD